MAEQNMNAAQAQKLEDSFYDTTADADEVVDAGEISQEEIDRLLAGGETIDNVTPEKYIGRMDDTINEIQSLDGKMPEEDHASLMDAARTAKSSMEKFSDGEYQYGAEPSVWANSNEVLNDVDLDVSNLSAACENKDEKEIQNAYADTNLSLSNVDSYYKEAYDKLVERSKRMEEEIAEMRKQTEELEETFGKAFGKDAPDVISNLLKTQNMLLQNLAEAKELSKEKKDYSVAKVLGASVKAVHGFFDGIKNLMNKARNYVLHKAEKTVSNVSKYTASMAKNIHNKMVDIGEATTADLNIGPNSGQIPVAAQQEKQQKEPPAKEKERTKDEPVVEKTDKPSPEAEAKTDEVSQEISVEPKEQKQGGLLKKLYQMVQNFIATIQNEINELKQHVEELKRENAELRNTIAENKEVVHDEHQEALTKEHGKALENMRDNASGKNNAAGYAFADSFMKDADRFDDIPSSEYKDRTYAAIKDMLLSGQYNDSKITKAVMEYAPVPMDSIDIKRTIKDIKHEPTFKKEMKAYQKEHGNGQGM